MKTSKFSPLKHGPSLGLCDTHVNSFLTHLRSQGYAERTLRKKRSTVASFARWTVEKQLSVDDLNASHLTSFIDRLPVKYKPRINFEQAALRPFLKYLRAETGVPLSPLTDSSPVNDLKHRYMVYLRNERGLTENSLRVYLPFIHDFLNEQIAETGCISPMAFDACGVRDFLLARVRYRSSECSRLLATALRSFFRFLYLRGETSIDLSLSVPRLRRWGQAQVHAILSPEDVERILSATELSTPIGRRDHAILLLLARLGLRAGEVVALELGDILWQTGEILVRGKGRLQDRLPLLTDVGEALALYLRQDRTASISRKVFVRMLAPRVGLAGPGAVGHIVRQAICRADLRSPNRGAAHLFRHSLATRMIRHGASMAEISEILRHRSQSTTGTYAKVDFEALREVASPWPAKGGAR